MLKARLTGKFRQELRLMEKRHKDMAKLDEVMIRIGNEQPLPSHYEDHPLSGTWRGCRECHIEPNWLLIYRISTALKTVVFERTGSHADLFT